MKKKTRSMLAIEPLEREEIEGLLRLAQRLHTSAPRPLLKGKRVALLFYEASTRTRVSFEIAAKLLGAITTIITASASSIEKGESLIDTGLTLTALGADAIVMRHPSSGAPNLLARNIPIPVINAGDGMHEHPTQALLDAFTMMRHGKKLKGLRVAIVGDILHSRVARSNAFLLTKMGAQVTFCGPPELAPDVCATLVPGLRLTRHLDEAVRGADVVMMLRVQKERLSGLNLNVAHYIANYQMTAERLKLAKKDALLMHPGPIIRGMELTGDVADCPQSVILDQVHSGIHTRMAVLAWALGVAK